MNLTGVFNLKKLWTCFYEVIVIYMNLRLRQSLG